MWGSIFLNCQVLNHPGGDLSRPVSYIRFPLFSLFSF